MMMTMMMMTMIMMIILMIILKMMMMIGLKTPASGKVVWCTFGGQQQQNFSKHHKKSVQFTKYPSILKI